MIAAILESGEPERLYTGLSLLVSAAADGTEARGLVSFGALAALLDDDLEARARAAPHVAPGLGRPLLLHGRQPGPVLRLPGLGIGAAGEPDRRGLLRLLAAESAGFPLTLPLGPPGHSLV